MRIRHTLDRLSAIMKPVCLRPFTYYRIATLYPDTEQDTPSRRYSKTHSIHPRDGTLRFSRTTSVHAFRRIRWFHHSSYGRHRPEDVPHLCPHSSSAYSQRLPLPSITDTSIPSSDSQIRFPLVLDISSSRPPRILLSTSGIALPQCLRPRRRGKQRLMVAELSASARQSSTDVRRVRLDRRQRGHLRSVAVCEHVVDEVQGSELVLLDVEELYRVRGQFRGGKTVRIALRSAWILTADGFVS